MKLYLSRHMIEFTSGRLCELLNADFRFLPFLSRISAERDPSQWSAHVSGRNHFHYLGPDLLN